MVRAAYTERIQNGNVCQSKRRTQYNVKCFLKMLYNSSSLTFPAHRSDEWGTASLQARSDLTCCKLELDGNILSTTVLYKSVEL